MLIRQILCRAKVRVHILKAVIGNKGNVLCVFRIQRNSYLHISVHRTIQDVRSPWILHIILRNNRVLVLIIEYVITTLILSIRTSKATVLKGPYSKTDLNTVICHIQPTVCKIELKHLRIVQEHVTIHIVYSSIAGDVCKKDSTPFISHLK